MKEKALEAKQNTTKTFRNIVEFVQASALVTVAAYAAYAVKVGRVDGVYRYLLAFASAIIALRGAIELLRHFNK